MSEKYIAKKYVATANLTDRGIRCPNCHQPMTIAGRILYCMSNPKCKLQDVPYREVKSLTTIQRVDTFRGIVEEMGFGLTFRSCTCGQLPCARLKRLKDALKGVSDAGKQSERERCAKIAEDHRDEAYRLEEAATERRDRVIAASRASIARSIAAAIREGRSC